jgi:predicted secreted protein
MFTDNRSKKVIILAHCILNQNAKIDRCAHYPGPVPELVEILLRSGAGLIQLPCPELLLLGLDRGCGDRSQTVSIAAEDTRVACEMNSAEKRAACLELARPILAQVRDYQKNGFRVLGLLGINGSPTCGVESTWTEASAERPGPGVFIQAVQAGLKADFLRVPMRGVKVYQPEQAAAALTELLNYEEGLSQ